MQGYSDADLTFFAIRTVDNDVHKDVDLFILARDNIINNQKIWFDSGEETKTIA